MSYFVFFCTIAIVPLAYSANFIINIEGLENKFYQNIKKQLYNIMQEETIINSYFRSRIEKIIKEGLKPFGYYEPKIGLSFFKKKISSILTIKVILGRPVILSGIETELQGEVKKDHDYEKIIKNYISKIGDIQNDSDYESFKDKFNNLAIRKGYFDAIMVKSQLGILLNKHASYWCFNFNSGKRYKFGKILYKFSQINEDYLNNIAPFKYGEFYTSDQLVEFYRRLIISDWFSSVSITPLILNARKSNSYNLPMEVILTPKSKNFIDLGVGYSTDIGPRIKATWNKPWINSYGQSFISNIKFANREQLIDILYKIPLKTSPLEQFYVVQTGFKRTSLNDTQANTSTFNVLRNWNFSNGWQYGFNMHWMFSNFTQANITNKTTLIYFGANVNRIRKRGDIMPMWGDSQSYLINYSDDFWKSDVDFFILQTKHVWIRSPSEGHRFILRGNLGLIGTNTFEKIPPDLRFFAGGDGKIRGYGYQKISPEDNQGRLIGASKLLIASIEYQYNFTKNWWEAVFIDAGEAVNDINFSKLKSSAGVGVRWASPVGPIKFDFAVPFSKLNHEKIQFYIGLGAEL
ncbi:Translocation and assembly module TamA [Candidatus Providencia siddallii]|uniref:Translocation and assembly module subunit TamA n=1 Tax=Candidatus Providencia siddallii TaxID=1715285 RepID=A0A0M6W837_9GAMM|nr:Translocation and assembly module TamA [Candidatus Providencia siddallii]